MNLVFDIESLPTNDEDRIKEISDSITPPGNYKNADTISKWECEKKPYAVKKAIHDTGFCGTVGSICCICWVLGDGEIQCVSDGAGEKEMLTSFMSYLSAEIGNRKPTWVGHYITGFDLRFLWQRCIINNVYMPIKIPYNVKPWDSQVFDTKIEWDGIKPSGFGTLDSISKAMGFSGKQGMTGADVWDYYKAGKINKIVEYCKDDVRLTREIFNKMS